jgi:hypothetical protein
MMSHELARRLQSIAAFTLSEPDTEIRANVDGEDALAIVVREKKPFSGFLELELTRYTSSGLVAATWNQEEQDALALQAITAEAYRADGLGL